MMNPSSSNNANQTQTGSPKSGEPVLIAVGKIRRPHGVKGEVIFEPYPEYAVRLKAGKMVFVGKKKEAYSLRSVRSMDQNFLIAFDSLNDCDQVGHMRNAVLYLQSTELNRPQKGTHYPHEVLDMQVVDESGKLLGTLEEVLVTGANEVYVIKKAEEDEEILLPAIEDVILAVDEEKRVITVRPQIWD